MQLAWAMLSPLAQQLHLQHWHKKKLPFKFCICHAKSVSLPCSCFQNKEGLGVTSAMCVTAPKMGRKVAVMGSGPVLPAPDSAFVQLAQKADVLVSGAVAPPSSTTSRGHAAANAGALAGLSAAEFGELAARLQVDRLMLARLDLR